MAVLHPVLDRVLSVVTHPPPGASRGPHYTCPDCGQTCACSGDARLLPHRPCGTPAERS